MKARDLQAMIQNRLKREQIYCKADYWDSKAGSSAGASVSMWPNNHLNAHYHREQIAWLDQHIGPVSGKRVLDAGCGFGRLSEYYASRGAQVVGFDFSSRTIELARGKGNKANPTFRVQSVFDLDDRNVYDVVIVWGMLTVACRDRAELSRALTRLRTALVPGGRFLMMEPFHKGFLHRVLKLNMTEVASVMREVGFTINDITNLHFWPARIALAYVQLPRLVTTAGYFSGQAILGLLGRKAMGDYKAVSATRDTG